MSKARSVIHVHTWDQSIASTNQLLQGILSPEVSIETQQMDTDRVNKTMDALGAELTKVAQGEQPTHHDVDLFVINPNTVTHQSEQGHHVILAAMKAALRSSSQVVIYGEGMRSDEVGAWRQALAEIPTSRVIASQEELQEYLGAVSKPSEGGGATWGATAEVVPQDAAQDVLEQSI